MSKNERDMPWLKKGAGGSSSPSSQPWLKKPTVLPPRSEEEGTNWTDVLARRGRFAAQGFRQGVQASVQGVGAMLPDVVGDSLERWAEKSRAGDESKLTERYGDERSGWDTAANVGGRLISEGGQFIGAGGALRAGLQGAARLGGRTGAAAARLSQGGLRGDLVRGAIADIPVTQAQAAAGEGIVESLAHLYGPEAVEKVREHPLLRGASDQVVSTVAGTVLSSIAPAIRTAKGLRELNALFDDAVQSAVRDLPDDVLAGVVRAEDAVIDPLRAAERTRRSLDTSLPKRHADRERVVRFEEEEAERARLRRFRGDPEPEPVRIIGIGEDRAGDAIPRIEIPGRAPKPPRDVVVEPAMTPMPEVSIVESGFPGREPVGTGPHDLRGNRLRVPDEGEAVPTRWRPESLTDDAGARGPVRKADPSNPEAGIAGLSTMGHVAAGGAGGIVGAGMNPDDPAKGAFYGALAGVGGAAGLHHIAKRQAALGQAVIPMGDRGKVGAWARRNFFVEGDLPGDSFRSLLRRDGQFNQYMRQMEYSVRDLERTMGRVGDSDYAVVNAALAGDQAALGSLHPDVQRAVGRMRTELDALSNRLIQSGAAQGDLAVKIDSNKGVYLHRSYQVFDSPEWASMVDPALVNKAFAWFKTNMPHLADDEIQNRITKLLSPSEAREAMTQVAQSPTGAKDLSAFRKRGDIPEEIRQLMGEYTDARINYSRSVSKMADIVANHNFQQEVVSDGLGKYLFKEQYEAPRHFVQLGDLMRGKDRTRLGDLANMYTTPEIAAAFANKTSSNDAEAWVRWMMRASATGKVSKTVFSPITNVRNFVGNVGFAVANGYVFSPNAPRYWKEFGESLKTVATDLGAYSQGTGRFQMDAANVARRESFFRELTELGVVHESARGGELNAILQDVTKMDFDDWMTRYITGPSGAAKRGAKLGTRIYQSEDDVWKIFGYMTELKRYGAALEPGVPIDQLSRATKQKSADIIRNTWPTYSMIPEAVKKLRRFPFVAPFVSFPAEVLRVSKNLLKQTAEDLADPATKSIGLERAGGILAAATGTTAVAYATQAAFGFTQEKVQDLRRFMPRWSKNSEVLIWDVSDDGKKVQYIDISYTDPYSYLRKPVIAMLAGEEWESSLARTLAEAFDPIVSGDVFFTKVGEAIFNQTMDGKRVYNPYGGKEGREIFNHLWDGMEPGFITQGARIYDAARGRRASGPGAEALSVATGQRISTADIPTSLRIMVRDWQKNMIDAGEPTTSRLFNRGEQREQGLLAGVEQTEQSRQALFREMHETIQSAIRFGMTEYEVFDALNGAGISRKRAFNLIDGYYEPFESPKSLLKRDDIPDLDRRLDIVEEVVDRVPQGDKPWLRK